jgi:mannosyltransferase
MDDHQIEIIVTNLKRRHSGVSSTIFALLPWQRKIHQIGYLGENKPSLACSIGWLRALAISFSKPPAGRKFRIWHVRRDHEIVIALLIRWLSRGKIEIVFTSAAQRFHGRFVRWITGKVDAVVATTEQAAAYCSRVAAIIGHGVDCERFHPGAEKSQDWQTSGLPGSFGIGVFGRVRAEKGIDVFVAAMLEVLPEFPAATALIVGDCLRVDQPFKDRLVKKIRAAGMEHRFVWTGYIPNEQIPIWYQRASIAVACPRYEGYGLTLFEAAACGCAVIGSNTGAFPLLIEEGKSGFLVSPGEVESLSRALRTMLRNPSQIEAMGRAAREKVVREFSVEREARQLAKLYDELLGSERSN